MNNANDRMIIASGYPSIALDRTLTFAGVLQKCFVINDTVTNQNVGISREWNGNTKVAYLNDYTERILPILASEYGAQKPMRSYTKDDFQRVVDILRSARNYENTTVLHYEYLLRVVYQFGAAQGYYSDTIFDETGDYEYSESKAENQRIKMTLTRKSLSIVQELRLMKWFMQLDPLKTQGQDIGLLLMFFLGLRNNEACGANFACLHTLSEYPQTPVFDMVQTTMLGSNQLKASGKTSNAPRVIPAFTPFYDFILARRRGLERLIEAGELHLPAGVKSIDQLPIVCKGLNYTNRCESRDITAAAQKLFDLIEVRKEELSFIHNIVLSEDFQNILLDEKEPSAYLLRRNFATHLYQIGLSAAEIQYLIGHEIEDSELSRNSFADADSIQKMSELLKKNLPLYCCYDSMPHDIIINHMVAHQIDSILSDTTLQFEAPGAGYSNIIVSVDAIEPRDDIEIEAFDSIKCGSSILTTPSKIRPMTANISQDINEAYSRQWAIISNNWLVSVEQEV